MQAALASSKSEMSKDQKKMLFEEYKPDIQELCISIVTQYAEDVTKRLDRKLDA